MEPMMQGQSSKTYKWKEVLTSKSAEMYGRRGFSCTLVGHKLIVLGTVGALSFDSQNWGAILNVRTRTWQRTPGFVFGLRLDGHSSSLIQDKIYIFGITYALFGGVTRRSNQMRIMDLVDATWTTCPARGQVPPCLKYHSMSYLEDVDMLVMVGGFPKEINDAMVYLLKLGSSTWERPLTKGERPSSRFLHASCATKDKVIVTGGRSTTLPFDLLDDASIYVLSFRGQLMWQKVPVVHAPVLSVKWMALASGGRVIIFGANDEEPVLADAYFQGIHTDEEQRWKQIRSPGAPHVADDVFQGIAGDDNGLWHLIGGSAPSANVFKIRLDT